MLALHLDDVLDVPCALALKQPGDSGAVLVALAEVGVHAPQEHRGLIHRAVSRRGH
jgi:hypothetical protein